MFAACQAHCTTRTGKKLGRLPQQLASILKDKLEISVDTYNSIHDPPDRSGSQYEENDDLSVVGGEEEIQTGQVEEDENVFMVEDFDLSMASFDLLVKLDNY